MAGNSGHWQRSLAYFSTAIVILIAWSWYLTDLGSGHLYHFDEFYTYDRSTGFARNDDWLAVYSNNEPSLKKPPLQYWMSGLLMEVLPISLSAMKEVLTNGGRFSA